MLLSSIHLWFQQLIPIPSNISIKDLSDGVILTQVLNKVDPNRFPPIKQLSPQKNFQMDLKLIRDLIDVISQQYESISIDALKIAKDQDEEEIVKLLILVLRLLFETQLGQDSIQQLDQQSTECILNFVLGRKQQSVDQVLLDKIDELENENQSQKDHIAELDKEIIQLKNKLTESNNIIKQKDCELEDLKLNLSNKDISSDIQQNQLIENLKKQIQQQNKDLKQYQLEKEETKLKLAQIDDLKQINTQLVQELNLRSKQDKQIDELKQKNLIKSTMLEQSEAQIKALQEQIKQIKVDKMNLNESNIQLELKVEQVKQELEEIKREKNREIFQLQQQLNESKQLFERSIHEQSQETCRSSFLQQSPRNLDLDMKSVFENTGGYLTEETIQELQMMANQKEQLHQEQMKTIQSQLDSQKERSNQLLQCNSELDKQIKTLQQELESVSDQNYQVKQIKEQKQQNMLLVQVIDKMVEKLCLKSTNFHVDTCNTIPKVYSRSGLKPSQMPFKTSNH